MTVAEIQVIQNEITALKERIDKQDENQKRIWERIDQQAKDMVRIQVLMEGISKTLDEVKIALATMNNEQKKTAGKWEQFWSKAFWSLASATLAYLAAKYGH